MIVLSGTRLPAYSFWRRMRATLSIVVALALLPLSAAAARAQDASGAERRAVAPAAPDRKTWPTWDLAASTAWRQRRVREFGLAGIGEWSHDSAWFGAEAGYHWTEHLKTEAGVAVAPRQEIWGGSREPVVVAGRRYWQNFGEHVRARRFFAHQLYQFRHNEWVHPFAGAGVQVLREESSGVRYLYPVDYTGSSREEALPRATRWRVAGSAVAGVKMYFSRRAFLRTDGAVVLGKRVDEVVLRVGAGIDF